MGLCCVVSDWLLGGVMVYLCCGVSLFDVCVGCWFCGVVCCVCDLEFFGDYFWVDGGVLFGGY